MPVIELIEISLSKRKLILMLIGAIVLVISGAGLLIIQPKGDMGIFTSPFVESIMGISAIAFFGYGAILIFLKLDKNGPGLIIDQTGIEDYSGGIAAGLIPWRDINEIKAVKIANEDVLFVIIKNPEDYINCQTNMITRNAMAMNYKYYGSPISISSNGLKCNFEELRNILQTKLLESRE